MRMYTFFLVDFWRSKRGRPKKHGVTHPHRPSIMMNDRCSFDGCENRPTKHGNGRCRAHGGRTKCNHLGCDSFAQKGGKCGSHRPDKICSSTTGCTNLPQKNGVCKTHDNSICAYALPYHSIFLHTHFGKSGKRRLEPTQTATTSSILCRRHGPIWPKLKRHIVLSPTCRDMSATFPPKLLPTTNHKQENHGRS